MQLVSATKYQVPLICKREKKSERDEIEREEEINKKQEHRIRTLEAKALQNVNLYFIFQAVILASTTLSSSSSATCRNSWSPIALSLVAAVTNFLGFFAHVSKILKSREELDQKLSDVAFIKLHKLRREEINQVEPGASYEHQGGEITRPEPGSSKKRRRRFVAYVCIGLFGGFSGIVMYGCYRILSHPGQTKGGVFN